MIVNANAVFSGSSWNLVGFLLPKIRSCAWRQAFLINSFLTRIIPLFQIFATPNVLKTECAQRVNFRDLHIDATEQTGLDDTVVKL